MCTMVLNYVTLIICTMVLDYDVPLLYILLPEMIMSLMFVLSFIIFINIMSQNHKYESGPSLGFVCKLWTCSMQG